MGSVRSASTAYSSGGLFGRNRHNSVVYSSPEAGQPPHAPPPPHAHAHKMSLYERLVGRKSGRSQLRQNSRHGTSRRPTHIARGASSAPQTILIVTALHTGGPKSNGSAIPITLRNRPRIPTPDVTKEVMDRENRLAMGMQNMGVIMAQGYQSEVPVLGALVLSPIQELDGGSVNNTLHAGQPGTTALAQAVLSPGMLGSVGGAPVTLAPLTALVGSTPGSPRGSPAPPRATLTELPPEDRDSEHSGASAGPATPVAAPAAHAADYKPDGSKRGEVYV